MTKELSAAKIEELATKVLDVINKDMRVILHKDDQDEMRALIVRGLEGAKSNEQLLSKTDDEIVKGMANLYIARSLKGKG